MIIRYASFFHSNKSIPTFAMVIPEKWMVYWFSLLCLNNPQVKTWLFRRLLYGQDFLWPTCPLEVPLLSTFSANYVFCRTYFTVMVRTLSSPWTFRLFGQTTPSISVSVNWSFWCLHCINWDLPCFIIVSAKKNQLPVNCFLLPDYCHRFIQSEISIQL